MDGRLGKICACVLAVAIGVALPTTGYATVDGWPALHDVVFVEETDVLNVRSAPDASAEIIGSLPHDATNIEVIRPDSVDQDWGLVNIHEGQGWVSMRFMDRHPGQSDGLYPQFAYCGGTEPFWSLHRRDGSLALEIFLTDRPVLEQSIRWETGTVNHRHRYSFATDDMVGFVARQYCDDGMSDNEFGLELNLVLPEEVLHLQGCCSLEPRGE